MTRVATLTDLARSQTTLVAASEIDDFNLALPRLQGGMHRAGGGTDTTDLEILDLGPVQLLRVRAGFAMTGTVDVDTGVIALGIVRLAPPGTVWNETDLSPGDVVLYPAQSQHQAVDPLGLEIGVAVIREIDLLEGIYDLGRRPTALDQGRVAEMQDGVLLRAYERSAATGDPTAIVSAVATALSTPPRSGSVTPSRKLSNQRLVRAAMGFAEESGDWLPSSLSLCRAAGVSERRLQTAFHSVFGLPPSAFFRMRALSEARKRLGARTHVNAPVSEVALGLGFRHFGRFAADYRRQFGELPSETVSELRRSDRAL